MNRDLTGRPTLHLVTGKVQCGQIAPADRRRLRPWLQRFAGVPDVAFAFEADTPHAWGQRPRRCGADGEYGFGGDW